MSFSVYKAKECTILQRTGHLYVFILSCKLTTGRRAPELSPNTDIAIRVRINIGIGVSNSECTVASIGGELAVQDMAGVD